MLIYHTHIGQMSYTTENLVPSFKAATIAAEDLTGYHVYVAQHRLYVNVPADEIGLSWNCTAVTTAK